MSLVDSRTLCGKVKMFRCPICSRLNEQSWVCECGQVILHFDDTEVYVAEAVANQFIEERKNNRNAEAKARDENKLQKPQEEKHSQLKCDHCNKSFKVLWSLRQHVQARHGAEQGQWAEQGVNATGDGQMYDIAGEAKEILK